MAGKRSAAFSSGIFGLLLKAAMAYYTVYNLLFIFVVIEIVKRNIYTEPGKSLRFGSLNPVPPSGHAGTW